MSLILTKNGEALIAKSIAEGTALKLKYIAVGDGNGEVVYPSPIQTVLIHEVYRGEITDYVISADDPNTIFLFFVLPTGVGGWTIREIGVFDVSQDPTEMIQQPIMLAVGDTSPIYKPTPAEGQPVNVTLKCSLKITSDVQITFSTDPYFATIKEEMATVANAVIDIHNEDPLAHPDIIGIPLGGNDGDVLVKSGFEDRVTRWESSAVSALVKDPDENYYIR